MSRGDSAPAVDPFIPGNRPTAALRELGNIGTILWNSVLTSGPKSSAG